MKKMSEGRKMWVSVMVVFAIYAVIFILFEDYDRRFIKPFDEASDWHLLLFSLIVMVGLGGMLLGYARQMDKRISREQAEKEGRMRRELTQNIAHELKTPVASILGYTETILNTPGIDEDTRNQFITRTHMQAQRLTALLQDISILNRMDYAMTLTNSLPQGIIVRGNPSLLYSIFRNLIDNALNYAGQGSIVKVYAAEETDSWHFVFADNGVGIPPEHLPRIFERFYRIDKGRSRSLGGTGLGLAIVKNAVILHGGTITAKPTEGGGLTFEFSIKKLGD